jgi:hypothetical protein
MNNHKFVSSTMTSPFKSSVLILLSLVLLLTGCSSNKPDPDPEPEPEPVVFDPMAYLDEKTGEVEISPGVTVDLQEFKQKEGLSFYFAEPFTDEEIDEMFEMYQPFYEKLREIQSKQGPNDAIQTNALGMNHSSSEMYLISEELGKILGALAEKVYTSSDPIYADYKQFIEVVKQIDKTYKYYFKNPLFDHDSATEPEKRYTVILFRFMREIHINQIYPKLGITYKCDICDIEEQP